MCRTYAYCRVSTERQSLSRQIDNVSKAYPNAVIYSDKWTGSTMERPNWQKLYKIVKPGDTIVFDSVSRMSRDAESGVKLYMELYEKEINLVFLNEPHINTATYSQALKNAVPMTGTKVDKILEGVNAFLQELAAEQIKIAFDQAEKERADICKRVRDGMKSAKIEAAKKGEEKTYGAVPGKKLVTKKSLSAKETIKEHSKEFGGSLDDTECMKLAGCSRNSFYKYKRELKAQEQGNE